MIEKEKKDRGRETPEVLNRDELVKNNEKRRFWQYYKHAQSLFVEETPHYRDTFKTRRDRPVCDYLRFTHFL